MKKLIIANWKMNLTIKDSLELARQFTKKIKTNQHEIVICPDFSVLAFIGPVLKGSGLLLGAQDLAAFDLGAYTGEVSARNLKSLGVKYVIIGHSERRMRLHENSALINSKIQMALNNKLIPVLCVGEKLTEKQEGVTKEYLLRLLRQALKGIKIKTATDLIIAYEPIWAISTNKKAQAMSASEAEEIHKFIQEKTEKILHQKVRILYGGSVTPDNAATFLAQKNVSGLLVGGASLQLNKFTKIVV